MRSERPIVHEVLVAEINRGDKGFLVSNDAVCLRQLPLHFLWVPVCFSGDHRHPSHSRSSNVKLEPGCGANAAQQAGATASRHYSTQSAMLVRTVAA